MIYIIGLILFILAVFVLRNPIAMAIVFVVFFIFTPGIYCVKYALSKIEPFNLQELKKQELIIQTVSFKKFLIQGTEVSSMNPAADYTDELQVYLVSGHADISFTDIDNLEMDETNSDYNTKTLRLNYKNLSREIPFKIDVVINENDIYKVTALESKPVDFLGYKMDLIKPDMSQAEKVAAVKEELRKEFERQIIKDTNAKKLEESDLYQSFLTRLEDIVKNLSEWQSVEVKFVTESE